MLRKLLVLLTALLFAVSPALADAYILHKPSKGQLTEKQAVAAASAFVASRFELSADAFVPYYECGSEKRFGPGWQWNAPTDDDCWCVSFPYTGTLPADGIYLTLHGKTGEVLYWSYRVKADSVSYTMTMPGPGQLSLAEVRRLIADRLAAETGVSADAAETMQVSGVFGPEVVTAWDCVGPKYPEVQGPIWSMVAWYPTEGPDCQYLVYADIDAETGNLLHWQANAE